MSSQLTSSNIGCVCSDENEIELRAHCLTGVEAPTDSIKINCLIHDTEPARLSAGRSFQNRQLQHKLKENLFLLRKVFQEGIVISRKDPHHRPQENEDIVKTYNSNGLDGSLKRVDNPTELIEIVVAKTIECR
ncbi:5183_t:CDS:2 [Ambispora leptoticha]|uniref:5183_t:CDS:1 n=1 Tax=Ambispora leptoticha TaxID=144679 RepID=A0A9N8ZFH7_9GLOM|nr:5183_t:CDS:2 [Ambispora leptoticha]